MRDHDDDHDKGLARDLPVLLHRRRALTLLAAGAGAGFVSLAGCSALGKEDDTASTGSGATSSTTTAAASSSTDASCATIPEETSGPYPGDGSNGVNVLTESGIVRSDLRSSFGDYSGTAEGVPLTVKLTVLDVDNGCAPFNGAAVYLWHSDRDGQYALYTVQDQNYLRGVQPTDASGVVTYTTIFPAAYSGRWPHIHFEVYPSVDEATTASGKLVTSQLAFPEDVCDVVYAADGYEQSVRNLDQTSLDSDMVFSDGYSRQLANVTGNVADGYTATLTVPV
jgi:protocatechuate 3,4-dioxygenase beta subunit